MTDGSHSWPPEYRCENCGWWKRMKRGFLDWLFRLGEPRLGRCTNPQIDDMSWRTYICERHTAGSYADLKPSLETSKRVFRIIEKEMRGSR